MDQCLRRTRLKLRSLLVVSAVSLGLVAALGTEPVTAKTLNGPSRLYRKGLTRSTRVRGCIEIDRKKTWDLYEKDKLYKFPFFS